MKYVIWRANALASFLLLTSCSGFAISLGPVRGNALIGRSLDLTIPARLDRGDDLAALCIEAELAYSDTRIDARRLTVTATPGSEAGQASIRVTSSAIVDEPVVSLNLRAGCSVKNTRRYVLLADLPVDVAERSVPLPSLQGGGEPSTRRGREASQTDGISAAPAVGTSARPSSGIRQNAPSARAAQAQPRRARVEPAVRAEGSRSTPSGARAGAGNSLAQSQRLGDSLSGTPRLRLDSADLPAETSPSLKSSAQLQALPSEADSRRSEFAALWRTLSLRPEEITSDLQKLQDVQTQATTLRDANTKSQAELGLAREQLKKAEAERFANPLVYFLAALLALLLLGAAFLYARGRRPSRAGGEAAWWDLRDADAMGRKDIRGLREVIDGPPVMATSDSSLEPQESPQRARVTAESFQPAARVGDSNYPASGMPGNARGVNVNELFDIAQQADFFVSLGQHDHAIEVLSNHIRENAQTSPLAYLDLFKLFHELGRKSQYDELRHEFNRIFNAEIPPFEAFRERGEGLEAYESAMTRIQSLWNTPKVLEVIEESIFRKPGWQGDAFGLEAYRELLLLYAMAHELVDAPGASPEDESGDRHASYTASDRDEPADYSLTELQPLGTALAASSSRVAPDRGPANFESFRAGNFALDIDLSEPGTNSGYGDLDATVILPVRKSEAFQPPSSAWLDFDLSDPDLVDPSQDAAGEGAPSRTTDGRPRRT